MAEIKRTYKYSVHKCTCGAGFNTPRRIDRIHDAHSGLPTIEERYYCPVCGRELKIEEDVL